jgi:glycerol kinase
VEVLEKGHGQDRFRAATGLPISTYFSAVKMRWLIDNVPEVATAVSDGRCVFGTIESWLIYNLTGGKEGGVLVTDVCNASRYMLMNINTQQWDEATCEAVGIPQTCLPTIVSNSEEYGKCVSVPGLEQVPITGALGDQHAALLGQGCLDIGDVKNTYGTGCFMLMNTGEAPVPSENGLLTTIGFKLGKDVKTVYALEGSIACTGRAVQWLRDNLGMIGSAPEVETLAKSVPDSGGVTFVPAFSGLFAPYWRSDARAVVVGMSLHTTKAHIARACLESVAHQTADVVGAMEADAKVKLHKLAVDGGMTKNGLLMQTQTDLLGIPVVRARMTEATCFGAAFAAGLSVGFWSDVEKIKAIHASWGVDTFSAAMDEEARKAATAKWADAIKRTHGLANL